MKGQKIIRKILSETTLGILNLCHAVRQFFLNAKLQKASEK